MSSSGDGATPAIVLDATAQLKDAITAGTIEPLPLSHGRQQPIYPLVPNDVFDRQRWDRLLLS
jgi:hypothetical protein